MSSRAARTLRGLGAAGVAVFVAAFSHVAGGGSAPGSVGLLLALAFSAVVCVLLAGKTLSLLRLSIGVGLSQLALHLLFSVGTPVGGIGARATGMAGMTGTANTTSMPGMGSMGSMGHGSGAPDLLALLLNGGTATQGAGHALSAVDCSWMWLAHLVAALVTVWALRRGEQSIVSVIESARMYVLRLVRVVYVERPTPRTPNGVVVSRDPGHPRALWILIGRLRHRGPPVWQFSLA
ncbi:hypothetical protein [Subtercola sp. YIM 133946]|uniref:hypothetical protein n=1 Tax=Subtercola sp. YIM 133946 TaxID=3118909 RepID=UPI002F93AC92